MKEGPREKHSRPPLARIQRIHEWIKGGKFPNAVTMARDLAVCDRTVKLDIEYMRDRHGAPIEYDRVKHGYFYTAEFDALPVAAMTEAEMFALWVADMAIAQYKGTPFQKPLRMAFKKLTGQLDDKELYSLQNLSLAISFRPFAPEDADVTAFRTITKGISERRALKFEYRNLGAKEWQTRHVHPYHVACIDSHWYLFGHDVRRGAIRTFSLTRLVKPSVTAERFTRPKKFDPNEYLRGSFGVMKGDVEQVVVIEFDAWATDLVRGRQWHSSQELTERSDGGSTLRMKLNSLEEIERWVLSWGGHASVVEPRELRERLGVVARTLAARYAECGVGSAECGVKTEVRGVISEQ